MNIRILSDAHSEMWSFNKFKKTLDTILPPLPTDAESILVCAGDIGTFSKYASTYKPFFAETSKRFKHVIVTSGNHSWYSSTGIWGNEATFWADKKLPENVHYLDNDYFIHEGIMFIGSCLWTSFNNSDPMAMWHASRSMNDFEVIRKASTGPYGMSVKLQPEDTVEVHHKSVAFIKKAMEIAKDLDLKVVVVTHHAPCALSIHEKYRGDMLNAAYYTDLNDLILDYTPYLWVHGHVHSSFNYTVGKTFVVCNPFGYLNYEQNPEYNSTLVLMV